jgi:hypothetical protein
VIGAKRQRVVLGHLLPDEVAAGREAGLDLPVAHRTVRDAHALRRLAGVLVATGALLHRRHIDVCGPASLGHRGVTGRARDRLPGQVRFVPPVRKDEIARDEPTPARELHPSLRVTTLAVPQRELGLRRLFLRVAARALLVAREHGIA